MADVSDTRTTGSIGNETNIAPIVNDLGRILGRSKSSFRAVSVNLDISRNANIQVETHEKWSESNDKALRSLWHMRQRT